MISDQDENQDASRLGKTSYILTFCESNIL